MTRRVLALVALSGSFVLTLGYNCIPNVPNLFSGITDQIGGVLGG